MFEKMGLSSISHLSAADLIAVLHNMGQQYCQGILGEEEQFCDLHDIVQHNQCQSSLSKWDIKNSQCLDCLVFEGFANKQRAYRLCVARSWLGSKAKALIMSFKIGPHIAGTKFSSLDQHQA